MTTGLIRNFFVLAASIALLAVSVAINPLVAAVGTLVLFVVAFAIRVHAQVPRLFLVLLGICLIGYAFLGRGFAHLPFPPLFIGELVLGFGLLAVLLTGGLARTFRSPLSWLLVSFMLLGTVATLPYIGQFGLDALRDAVVWGYGIFAILVATFLLNTGLAKKVVQSFGRWLTWFLIWTPIAVVVYRFAVNSIPTLPGSEVLLLNPKGGDIAVHLAGILAFLAVGLQRHTPNTIKSHLSQREWVWWALWLAACLTIFNVRAAILTVFSVILLVMLLRPLSRWGKVLFLSVLLSTAFIALDIEIRLSPQRTVSAQQFILMTQSILGNTGEGVFDGSRRWRIMWWTDIINYTVFGDYFWSGKGYGINLADADGYQVLSDSALRSPHNGHLTILARSGVPGALAWLVLQGMFAASLLVFYFRARRSGQIWWSKVNLWILCYWLAFMVNGSFDVFLEGPQGGIWFWSVFGFGIAALEMQRRGGYGPSSDDRSLGAG